MGKKIIRHITDMDIESSRRLKNIWNEKKQLLRLTQKELGKSIGVSQGMISAWLILVATNTFWLRPEIDSPCCLIKCDVEVLFIILFNYGEFYESKHAKTGFVRAELVFELV